MKQRLPLVFGIAFLFVLGLLSCTKINESTELGRDLIPAVDNVNTFDTTLEVQTFNELFTGTDDSVIAYSNDQYLLGIINNDPVFGKTTASAYFELKPALYPFSFPFKKDSAAIIDSVVLVLGYTNTWGDSNMLQQVNVHEINSPFKYDSLYTIQKEHVTYDATPLGTKSFYPKELNDSVFPRKEAAANQLRIRLSNSFAQKIYNTSLDTANLNTEVGFRNKLKGFALIPQNNGQANALIGFSLGDTNTKLAIYYQQKAGKSNGVDSIEKNVTYLRFTSSTSAHANYIKRDRSGSQMQTYLGGTAQDDQVFIQNTPGSYARIVVPGLRNLSNRIVHRAELVMEQITDPLSDIFTPPSALYVDIFDTIAAKYRALPNDVELSATGYFYDTLSQYQITNPVAFGMLGQKTGSQYIWKFNVSRYIQRVVNKTVNPYNFRLSATSHAKDIVGGITSTTVGAVLVNGLYGTGRVRLGGGNHSINKMRLRIIYSKI